MVLYSTLAISDSLDHGLDDRALRNAEPRRDFSMRQMMKLNENEDLPAFRRKLCDAVLQQRHLLLRPDNRFDGRTGIRLVDRHIGIGDCKGRPMLLAAVMVHDEICGDAKEKRARIDEGLLREGLEQAKKCVLRQVLGCFSAAQPAREELLQVASMFADER